MISLNKEQKELLLEIHQAFCICTCPDKGLTYGDQCLVCGGYTKQYYDDVNESVLTVDNDG